MWGMSEKFARERVRLLVQKIKEELNSEVLVQNDDFSNRVAAHLNIDVIYDDLPNEFGLYVPYSSPKPSIILDINKQGQERLRFTFFHEITHHLIRQDAELYSWIDEIQNHQTLIERLCNIGASEFLLPISEVRKSITSKGFSISLLPHLEEVCQASKPSILTQIIECANHKCYGVICCHGSIPDHSNEFNQRVERVGIYVEFAVASLTVRYTIGKYGIIEKDHLISDAYTLQTRITGRGRIPFRNGRAWNVPCEAIYYKGKVYAIFNVEEPVMLSPDQLTLF